MSSIIDTLFGGSDDSAQKAQTKQNTAALALQEKLAQQARGDVLNLLPTADINRNLGFQSALDVFGQGTAQQLGAFQGGNVGAQNMLLGGLPQVHNAILGRQTDLSGFQPQQIAFDPSFLQQQLPQFTESISGQQAQQNVVLNNLSKLLGGTGGLNIGGQGAGGRDFEDFFSGVAGGGSGGGIGNSASNFDTALGLSNAINSPMGILGRFAIPGAGLLGGLTSMGANSSIANALGVDSSFFDGFFGEGDAAAAAAALGLTGLDFMSGGVPTNSIPGINPDRDIDRFGSPRSEDRGSGGDDFGFGEDGTGISGDINDPEGLGI